MSKSETRSKLALIEIKLEASKNVDFNSMTEQDKKSYREQLVALQSQYNTLFLKYTS